MAENLSIKDAVVFIPVAASSIAITWEVGRFSQFGGFRYFTLAEHLTAATFYLPVALLISGGVTLVFWAGTREPRLSRTTQLTLWAVGTAIWIGLTLLFRKYIDAGRDFWVMIVIFSAATLAPVYVDQPLGSAGGIIAVFAFGIFATLLLSVALAVETVNGATADPQKYVTDITYKDGSKKAAVAVMAGDRGVLFYDPTTRHTSLVRWDDIKTLDWTQ